MDKNKVYNWVIYKITSPSDKVYIGKTSNYERRMYLYKHSSNKRQRHLYHSFKKYGFKEHKVDIIDSFIGTLGDSNSKEMFWIRTYMSNYSKFPEMGGMNLTDGGEGLIGVKITDETIQKMKKWHKENPKKNMLGKKATDETKLKQSIAKIGKSPYNKGKKGIQVAWNKGLKGVTKAWNKGKSYSYLSEEERKEKFGKHNIGNSYNKGRKQKPEFIESRVKRQTGKPLVKKFKPISQYSLTGEFIKDFPAIKIACEELKISKGRIMWSLHGKSKRPTLFIFKYKKDIEFTKFTFQRRILQQNCIKSKVA